MAMHPNTRACTAYVAARLISELQASSIYDYFQSKYISIDGPTSSLSVNVYDYDRGAYFGGSGFQNKFSLYDYGTGGYVDLTISTSKFEGYDYVAGCFFSGDVTGKSISFFDYDTGSYFNYSL